MIVVLASGPVNQRERDWQPTTSAGMNIERSPIPVLNALVIDTGHLNACQREAGGRSRSAGLHGRYLNDGG